MKPSPSRSMPSELFLVGHVEIGLVAASFQKLEQSLLRDFAELHLADDGEFGGRGHHQLATREVGDGAAKRFLLDGEGAQAFLLGGEAGGKP